MLFRSWIFQPSNQTWWGGLSAAEGMQDVWIDFPSRETGRPARLHGLWLAQANADAPVLLVNDRQMCSYMSTERLDELLATLRKA